MKTFYLSIVLTILSFLIGNNMLHAQVSNDILQAYQLGMQYHNSGKHKEAIPWLEKAAKGNYYKAYLPLALSYHSLPGESNHEKAYWNYGHAIVHEDCFSRDELHLAFTYLGIFKEGGVGSISKDLEGALFFMERALEYASGANRPSCLSSIERIKQEIAEEKSNANRISPSFTLGFYDMDVVNGEFVPSNRKGEIAFIDNGRSFKLQIKLNGKSHVLDIFVQRKKLTDDCFNLYDVNYDTTKNSVVTCGGILHLTWNGYEVHAKVSETDISKLSKWFDKFFK